jgi:two-component system, NtrC family, nitrogen regulation response regulator NtrX
MFPSILIVDDEVSIRKSLEGLLADEGYEVTCASNGYEALKMISVESPDLVLLDIWMQGIDGIETLKEIKKTHPNIQVIMITGHGRIDTAVKAIKHGAFDFIEKPLSIDRVIVAINNALNFRRLEEENKYLRKKTIEKHSITGKSPAVLKLKEQIAKVAPTDAWVLINGENGTGKELVARTIHHLSDRAEASMIDINCAFISKNHLETELFGHEKNISSLNTGRKIGKFELANHGTIFFDEIGDMDIEIQSKILKVLQDKKFSRIGGSREIDLNIRVIAATNKELEKEISAGRFREDLYFRINVVPIFVPPLRERKEDIPELVKTFISDYAQIDKIGQKEISKGALEMLQKYSWPGNIRELKNLVERLLIMVEHDIIKENDIITPYNPKKKSNLNTIEYNPIENMNLKEALHYFEKEVIRKKLEKNNNNIEKAAQDLSVNKGTLRKKMKNFKLY